MNICKKVMNVLLVLMCVLAVGCGNEKENVLDNAAASVEETVSETVYSEAEVADIAATENAVEEETVSEEFEANRVGDGENGIAYEELPDDIKGMLIPIDSLLMYNAETGGEYNADDSEMFWTTMHYAIGNFGEFYNRAELREYELAAEGMVIGEFASALITNYEEIPSIPDSLSGRVRYDSEEDMYFFGVGDRGLSQTEILSYEYIDSNTLKISARLFGTDDDYTICKGDFVLVRNDYAGGVIEPLFYFTVSEAVFDEK